MIHWLASFGHLFLVEKVRKNPRLWLPGKDLDLPCPEPSAPGMLLSSNSSACLAGLPGRLDCRVEKGPQGCGGDHGKGDGNITTMSVGKQFWALMTGAVMLAAMPASSNYQLHNYGFGSGGVSSSSSPSYKLNGITGEVGGQDSSSSSYTLKSGHNQTQQANVPPAPTFTNPANYYNKLHFVINTGGNPSDALFAIAISPDNFTTTYYVHPDDTISGSFNPATDYQTYAGWGSGTGEDVIGLTSSTTYKMKVRAYTGIFTETQFGPTATASTVAPQITFDIDVSPTDSSTSPPYIVSFGNLLAGSVVSASNYIWVSLDTNAESGGMVYVASQNGGLLSNAASHTITSATADLSAASEGEGAQVLSVAQTSGGPLAADSPYNSGSNNVGFLSTILQQIFHTSAPIVGGRGQVVLKAKINAQTQAAPDYADTMTMVAAASY